MIVFGRFLDFLQWEKAANDAADGEKLKRLVHASFSLAARNRPKRKVTTEMSATSPKMAGIRQRASSSRGDFVDALRSKGLKRTLAAIETAIGDRDSVEISCDRLAAKFHVGRAALPRNLRCLKAVGLIEVGTGRHRVSTFARSDRWQAVNLDDVPRLLAQARIPQRPKRATAGRPKTKIAVVETEEPDDEPVVRQVPSLARLRFMGEL